MPATPSPRSRLWRAWMVDTVRLAEAPTHPFDDGAIVRALVPGSAQQRVAARNLALADRLGLPAAAARWVQGAKWSAVALALLAIISGWLAARATVSHPAPINLFWALTGLLGLQWVTLILWLVSLVPGFRLGSVPLRLMLRAGNWWSQRASAPAANAGVVPPAALLPRSAVGMVQRAKLMPALGGLLSHLWWWLLMSSVLVTLLLLFATERYTFTWATTLLSPEVFLRFTQGLGSLPAVLGFPLPDADLVNRTVSGSTVTPQEQALWSQWLLGCIVVYGWLPRLIAGLVCLAWLLARRHALAPDWSATEMAVQCARLGDTHVAPQIVDPDPGTLPTTRYTPPAAASRPTRRHSMAVGLELPDDIPWPPADLGDATGNAGNMTDRAQRNAVLARLREQAPDTLWIAVDGRQTPDRGTLATLKELADRAKTLHLRIYADGSSEEGKEEAPRLVAWRRRLKELGLHHTITVVPITAPAAAPAESGVSDSAQRAP